MRQGLAQNRVFIRMEWVYLCKNTLLIRIFPKNHHLPINQKPLAVHQF